MFLVIYIHIYILKTADRTVSACWASSVQCRDLGKADTNANIYALPAAQSLWARKHHAMPECSNHQGSELCPMASDKASPSRVLNKLRLQGSKHGIHLPAQVTVKPLHHPKALPWKHWYLTCPEEQERNIQNCRQNCFGLLGLISEVQRLGKG